MKNYKIHDGCHNCKFCLIVTHFDDPTEYFCAVDGKPSYLPTVEGILLPMDSKEEDDYFKAVDVVNDWERTHYVYPYGYCDLHNKVTPT